LPLADKSQPEPIVQTHVHYQESKITITYYPEFNRMDADWIGFQDMGSVKSGYMLMLDHLTRNQCDRVANHNTHVMRNWSDTVEWVGNEWFPMMERAGPSILRMFFLQVHLASWRQKSLTRQFRVLWSTALCRQLGKSQLLINKLI
jgi:hypothetical protein